MESDADERPSPIQFYGLSPRTLILAAIALYLVSLVLVALVLFVP